MDSTWAMLFRKCQMWEELCKAALRRSATRDLDVSLPADPRDLFIVQLCAGGAALVSLAWEHLISDVVRGKMCRRGEERRGEERRGEERRGEERRGEERRGEERRGEERRGEEVACA